MSAMRAEKVTFIGADKTSRLAARLDLPHGETRAFANGWDDGPTGWMASRLPARMFVR